MTRWCLSDEIKRWIVETIQERTGPTKSEISSDALTAGTVKAAGKTRSANISIVFIGVMAGASQKGEF
ncbi:hypothetical protein E6H16_03165 [Candidatus Bathyarchaeota archaeon]|nr:MAG: hypothetical protein E6H16_03165 [Candidatus Bathyarchaeota archaeon]